MVVRTRLFRWVLSWKEYLKNRHTHPNKNEARSFKALARNTSISCALYVLGDTFEQRVEGYRKGANDWSRTRRMAVMGAFIGSIDTFWYTSLDGWIPGADGTSVARKVLLDQIVWSPFCCSSFFFGMSKMEGNTTNEAINEIKIKFWPTYKIDWLLWPPAQAINFLFVPPRYRVICVAFITFLWTVFLSYMKHKKMNITSTAEKCNVYNNKPS